MRQKIFLMLALLCAVAQGAWADEWNEVLALTQTTRSDWRVLHRGSNSGHWMGSTDGSTTYYRISQNCYFTNGQNDGSGVTIHGTVYLYVPSGVTVTCIGANATGATGAGAGIELASGNTLYLLGGGTINAIGGNAANGGNGGNGTNAGGEWDKSTITGTGGNGGNGGGGAGAGIGTRGGNGGACGNASQASVPIQGLGTQGNPFIIDSKEALAQIATITNSGATDFVEKHFSLTCDLDLSGQNWTPIGTQDHPFKGNFNGNNHTISNLTVNNPSRDYNGLFGWVEGWIAYTTHEVSGSEYIRNFVVKNANVRGRNYTGGIAGRLHGNFHFENVVLDGATVQGANFTSGFVGSAEGDHQSVGAYSIAKSTLYVNNCLFINGSVTENTGHENYDDLPGHSSYVMFGNIEENAEFNNNYFSNVSYNSAAALEDNYNVKAYPITTAIANLGSLKADYGTVKVYEKGIFYDGKYYTASGNISLADTGTNDVDGIDGYVADVTLAGRTLYKDGDWNTICLPFNVVLSGSALEGAVARPLTSASISESTLNLTFGDAVDELVAGTPYIIKWTADANNIENPVFNGVTIDKTNRSYDNGQSGDQRIRFIGTYASQSFDATDDSILLIGGENMLYYPANGASIGAQRAYFKIGEDGAAARRVTAFNVNFGDGETTGIISTTNFTNYTNSADAWYTLDGRRLSQKPSRAGVYINNGKKTVIK